MKNINRRSFLKGSALGLAGFAAGNIRLGTASAAAQGSDHTLVYIFLRGGMDALSMLPPTHAGLHLAYRKHRPQIAFDAHKLSGPAGGEYAFGISSKLTDLKVLWDRGDISFIHGFGSLTNTTSHFDQMNFIEGGSHQRRISEGFFQRLRRQAGWTGETALASIENVIPRSMSGAGFVMQYEAPTDLTTLTGRGVSPGLSKIERLNRNYSGQPVVERVTRGLASASGDVAAALGNVNDPRLANIPSTELKEVTRLLISGRSRPRVITTSLDGWDFHSNLADRFADPTGESSATALSESLRVMSEILKSSDAWAKTTIVVMSEFGRRMVQNGAAGADHGRGGVGLLLGGSIQGQRMIYRSDYVARLLALYNDPRSVQAQLPVDFDYRIVLSEIFEKQFQLSSRQLYGADGSVFVENIMANANGLALDTNDPLLSGISKAYSPLETKATLSRIIL